VQFATPVGESTGEKHCSNKQYKTMLKVMTLLQSSQTTDYLSAWYQTIYAAATAATSQTKQHDTSQPKQQGRGPH
jgi:hypothetical protein